MTHTLRKSGNTVQGPTTSIPLARVKSSPLSIPYSFKPDIANARALFQDVLSVSPLTPSPSMALLSKTAQAVKTRESMRKMPVETATSVFEVRHSPSSHGASHMSRQESLIAVFKPITESTNDIGEGLISRVSNGGLGAEDRALRERAAYVLDKMYDGFSHVPTTALAKVNDQEGSLQEFVRNEGSAEDNPALTGLASCLEVQRVAILDVRIFNMDRHDGNVLVGYRTSNAINRSASRNAAEESSIFQFGEESLGDAVNEESNSSIVLTPIDHGLSLPSWTNLGEAWFCWSYWPQAEECLTSATRELILRIDCQSDAKCLRELGIKHKCIVTNTLTTLALKAFAKRDDTTLRNLSEFFQRPYANGHKLHSMLSPFEHVIEETCMRALVMDKALFMPHDAFYVTFESVLSESVANDDWKVYVA